MLTFLSPHQHPYIRLNVPGVDEDIVLDCMIDTGFAGRLLIPASMEKEFDFPLIGRRSWQLADGSEVELGIYLGEIKTDNRVEEMAVIFTNASEGLVGIEFLEGKRFLLDLMKDRVEIT